MVKRHRHQQSNQNRRRYGFLALIILMVYMNTWAVQHSLFIPANSYSICEQQNGYDIHMKDFGYLQQIGCPRLPSRTFYIPLGDHIKVNHVNITEYSWSSIPGEYHINPVMPLIPSNEDQININAMKQFSKTRDTIYGTNSYFPAQPAEFLGIDYIGDTPYVKVQFTPIRYNPVANELEIVEGIQVDIDYTLEKTAFSSSLKKADSFAANPYTVPNVNSDGTLSLLIIGSEVMTSVVEPFIFWKSCLGIQTEFVTTQWIYTNQEGDSQSERIRNFLKVKYQNGLQNVLLIGHRDVIPYPILYPDPGNHTGSGEVATDFYFAQLTGKWDKDEDGYPGEFGEDNVDIIPEIHVGRIPWSDVATVTTILENIMAYECRQESWKSTSLLMGAISNFDNENNYGNFYWKTDGAVLMELMKQNIFSNTTTLYEKEGLKPSIYNSDLDLNDANMAGEWNTGGYGCVTWWSHGSSKSAQRKIWNFDDGDKVPESAEMVWTPILSTSQYPVLETNRPVVFANACDNGWPEKTSLGRILIQNACTGIVTSSRLTYSALGWDDINDGGNASLTYYFWDEYLNKQSSIGEALSQAKIRYYLKFNPSWQNLHNVYTFNYFGDPTIQATETSPLNGQLACQVISDQGLPAAGLRVEILELSQTVYTDSDGWFNFKMVPGGDYTVSISGDSVSPFTLQITIATGIKTTSTITIPSEKYPEIALSTSSIDVTLDEGSLSRNSLTIYNKGDAQLDYQLTYDTDIRWLILDKLQSSIDAGEKQQVNIDISAEDIDQGEYTATIHVTSNCQHNPSCAIPVKLTVVDVVAPEDINDLHISDTATDNNNGSIHLEWTAPGDNGKHGQASQYEIWISDWTVSDPENITASVKLMEGIEPKPAGSKDGLWVPFNLSVPKHIFVKTWDEAGNMSTSNIATYLPRTSIAGGGYLPFDFVLPNSPNPFNGETVIAFSVSTSCDAKVTVFNEIGQQVRILMNESIRAGKHTVRWNATNDAGMAVPSGVYFYHIQTGQKQSVRKMLLIK